MIPDRRVLWDSRDFGGPIPAGNPIPLPIAGAATHTAATLKISVIQPAGDGYLTCGDGIADVNFKAGITQSDATVVPLVDGGIAFSLTQAAHVQVSLLAFND